MKIHLPATAAGRRHRLAGLSLIELMVALAIIAILASVAYPSYQGHIMRTRRAAAAACVRDLSAFMERVYAANLRYDQNNGVATTRTTGWPRPCPRYSAAPTSPAATPLPLR